MTTTLTRPTLHLARSLCADGASLAAGMSRAAFGSDEPPPGNGSRDTLGFRLYHELGGGVYELLWTLGRIAPGCRPSPDPLDYGYVIATTCGSDAVAILDGAAPLIGGLESLSDLLRELARADTDLDHTVGAGDWGVPGLRRAALVGAAVSAAAYRAGMRAGFAVDPDGAEGYRTVAYVDLPTGQVSWHLPSGPVVPYPRYEAPFDGHTREEKAERIRLWIDSEASR